MIVLSPHFTGEIRSHSYGEKISVHLRSACHLYTALSFDTVFQNSGRYLWYFLVHRLYLFIGCSGMDENLGAGHTGQGSGMSTLPRAVNHYSLEPS